MGFWRKLFGGVTVFGVSGAAFTASDIQKYRVYADQSFGQAAKHYLSVRSLSLLGSVMRRKLEQATKDVEAAQTAFLMEQLKDNKNTEYSKDFQLDQVTCVQDFLSKHRLTFPQDYGRYIGRMMSGETNVLTSADPSVFAVTSGTSGSSNIVPMVSKQTKIFFLEGISVLYHCMVEAFPQTKFLNKDLKLFYSPRWRYSVTGIPIGPNSASPERSKDLLHIYSTPPEAYEVKSEPEALYLYLLFALLDCHLGMVEANFSSIIYNALTTMHSKLDQLTADIEAGQVSAHLQIDPDIRRRINAKLTPNPERAQEIRQAAQGGVEGMALRIWPELHMMLGADTGTFEIYGEKLRTGICKGIPLYSPIYAASEGLLGVNIWPNQLPSRYLLHPRTQFFECIPETNMDLDQPKTLLLHQVKAGESYEMVITNPSCLYRYRFGDVVKVVGFHNQCPIVQFQYRKGQFLNVRGEKTSESLFYKVLKEQLSSQFGGDGGLVDYCCAESVSLEGIVWPNAPKLSQPSYHVFIELETNGNSKPLQTVGKTQGHMMDKALMNQSYPYGSFRNKGSIGPITVHLVKPGTFDLLRSFMVQETSATSNQYKVPRVLRNKAALELLVQHIIK